MDNQVRQEWIVGGFPHLVTVLGYDRAFEELNQCLAEDLRDGLLFEDEARVAGMLAIENYWREDDGTF